MDWEVGDNGAATKVQHDNGEQSGEPEASNRQPASD
ncbi:hypothetical protein VDGD_20209 [Verticillium dahliae]|nr:hypothetical protein VDGD_20209 [Verticillium dahliae]